MTVTQQWPYLNLTRNSFSILFPAKGMVSDKQVISSRLYVRFKAGGRNLLTIAGRMKCALSLAGRKIN